MRQGIHISLYIFFAIVLSKPIAAQTNVSGLISSNTTWTLSGSPYIVTGNILVNNGVTLTIEPGVTVKFDSLKVLQIDGELIASGNAQNRITFTATDATPARGSWGRIQFSSTSADAVFDSLGNYVSGSIMKYCDIKYGGGVAGDVTLYCDVAAPYFSHCRISDCLKHAIYFVNSVGKVDSSSIRNGGGTALSYVNPVSAALIVKNDTLENNGGGIVRSSTGIFTNALIQNCFITNSGKAIDVSSSAGTNILNNVFTANSIAIQGTLGPISTISDNIFTGHTTSVIGGRPGCSSGVSTLIAPNIIVANNHIENNTGGILVQGYCTIQGNTFLNNRFHCSNSSSCGCSYPSLVFVIGGHGLMLNNVFDGNTHTFGNLILVGEDWEIANNLIKNNSPGLITCTGNSNICNNRFLNNSGAVIYCNYTYPSGAFIHDNEFLNNSGGGRATISFYPGNRSIINNNEFWGNSCTGYSIISDGFPTVYNNSFLNNLNSGCPIIKVSNSTFNIHNNDFRGNIGLSCLSISGTASPVVSQNNFVNPGIQYEIENLMPFSASNLNVPGNYWGTTSTAHIDSVVKDFFDDGSLSIVSYSPVLTSPALIDTTALCFTDTAVSLSGTIVTETGTPVPGVSVTLSGGYNLVVRSDTTGFYNFTIPQGGNYTVTPSKNNDVTINNGITSIDVLLTRRHILGTPFSTPYKIIAADVDASNSVSTLDILLMRSMILQNIATFPNGRLWSFVTADFVFPDLLNPFPFPIAKTYTNLQQPLPNQDFIGIKLADVNNSWDAGIP